MGAEPAATVDGPARKRESWSLKTIVEDVGGRPIAEFQDPERPVHPYLKAKLGAMPAGRPSGPALVVHPRAESEEPFDPVDRFNPPLVGETGRRVHGSEHEHHAATLGSLPREAEPAGPGSRPHAPGPSRRPERIYLHYLLLHMDRLHDHALRYLKHAVDEELAHREGREG